MKLADVKLELIEWLTRVDDEAMLKSLLIYKKANESFDWADDLSKKQKMMVEEGLTDLKAGRTHSRQKVWAKYGRKPKS
ncbi:MAG TPA: hypothetical protein VI731_05260 [Bacteroidia bacterium]|nr:hypothetical protein [Bacteroidia bacterium]